VPTDLLPETYRLSWITTFLCMFYSIRCATAFLLHNARLFTSAALFSLTWALVLTYYGATSSPPEVLSAFAAFLTVYSAGIVIRDCKGIGQRVSIWEWLPLAFLGALATTFSLPLVQLSTGTALVILSTCFYAVGDVAICLAIWWLAPKPIFAATVILFIIYLGFEVQYAYRFIALGSANGMTYWLQIEFGVCKILMTAIYMTLLVRHGLSAMHRKLPWWKLILVFCKLPV
jgi:hypothetical protein